MSTETLVLGPIVFENFEIPSRMSVGGTQRVVTHTLSDGTRVVELLGPDDLDIRYAGILSGANAVPRALQIDALRVSGQVVTLGWGTLLYSVIVREFSASFENTNWIPYRLACLKVGRGNRYGSAGRRYVADVISFGLQALTDLGSIAGLNTVNAEQALNQPGASVRGTDAYVKGLGLTTLALTACQAERQAVDQRLVAANVTAPTGVARNRDVLFAATDESYKLFQVSTATGYWSQIQMNLLNAST